MQEKRWLMKPAPSDEDIKHLKNAINASEPLAKILAQRGLNDFESVKRFFTPATNQLHPPFLMKDMDVAIDRITAAINQGENILVYGDYDVDGTTAVSLLYGFLLTQYENVSYYIPDRYAEGYGISLQGIDFASDNNISLIIALDCGIKAIEQIDYASERDIDFIICDHHLPGSELPKAMAILNPLQSDCSYPFKSLCGCGIAFKLVQGLSKAWELDSATPFEYIDLVAIATGADIVSMTGENRVLVYLGMRAMENVLRPGLSEMLEAAGLAEHGKLSKKEMTVSDMVFKIGPRINAAGRMDHGNVAVELLTAPTSKQAHEYALLLNQYNADRREEDGRLLEEALEMLKASPELKNSKSTVLYAEHWHKGVVGIAASRIQEHFYRPTIILTASNGKISGSARSVEGFDVHSAIEECADLLVNFGGHPAAAGMTLEKAKLPEFRKRFETAVSNAILEEQLTPCIHIDAEINLDDITQNFFKQLGRLSPFGPDNMNPVFVTSDLLDSGKSRCVGEGDAHLKLEVYQEGNRTIKFNGIGFGLGSKYAEMEKSRKFSLVYSLETNEYRGYKSIQLVVKDIRFD